MKKLTAKQEIFVLKIVEGISKTDAYKEVYDTSRMKPTTINKRAFDLFNQKHIQARYNELMQEAKEKSIWTLEEAVNDLIYLKEKARESIEIDGLRQANSNAFLSTIKELNTLLDLYPKKQVEEDTKEDKVADDLLNIMNGIRALHNGTN